MPPLPAISLGSILPRQTKPYIEAAAETEETTLVSEHQIKKEAMNGFDRPGYCFYGDQVFFQTGKEYPLPDTLSTCRMLREGGNGVVLEVSLVYESDDFRSIKGYCSSTRNIFHWQEVHMAHP